MHNYLFSNLIFIFVTDIFLSHFDNASGDGWEAVVVFIELVKVFRRFARLLHL